MTWLDALSLHAVFNDHTTNSSSLHDAEPLPPSPNLTGIDSSPSFKDGRSRKTGNGAYTDDAVVALQSAYSSTSSLHQENSTSAHAAGPSSSLSSSSSRTNIICNIRKTELLVAVGSQLRLCNLAHFKAKVDSSSGSVGNSSSHYGYDASWISDANTTTNTFDNTHKPNNTLGSFKTLYTPAVDFEILSLVPSPSSRYVAVVGRSQVVVVQVPRKGWDGLVTRSLDCSHDPIGPFYHSPSSPQIAQVSFHPWGIDETVILVLTEDGLLREYDINEDPEEPSQVVDFSVNQTGTLLPESFNSYRGTRYGLKSRLSTSSETSVHRTRQRSRSRSRSRSVSRATPGPSVRSLGKKRAFAASHDDEETPVSFCFGQGYEDWSPFTLYCLMKSGDLYCVCPYLPKKARVPSLLLETLSSLSGARLRHLSDGQSSSGLSLYEKRELEGECNAQAKFINDLISQTELHRVGQASLDNGEHENNAPGSEHVQIQYPSYIRNPPIRQGPFLFQPAPEDLHPDDMATSACDLLYMKASPDTSLYSDNDYKFSGAALGIIVIAYEDGRMDVCLDTARVEATWTKSDHDDKNLPSLLVFESIDLYGDQALLNLNKQPVRLVRDPEHTDTLLAYHHLGVHLISLCGLYTAIARCDDAEGSSPASDILAGANQAEVTWLLRQSYLEQARIGDDDSMIGFAVINDVFLGYAAIAIQADMRISGIELAFRTHRSTENGEDPTDMDIQSPLLENGHSEETISQRYAVFGDASPLSLPSLLSSRNTPQRISARFASPPNSSKGTRATREAKPTIELTIESLKFLGSTVESLDKAIRELTSAGNIVQDRLGLQLSEIPKQVDKLLDTDAKLEQHSSNLGARTTKRLEQIKQDQDNLNARADRILQRLMDASQPDLSLQEQEWIDELERVQRLTGDSANIKSAGGKSSLALRAERLREQVALLRPIMDRKREDEEIAFPKTSHKRLGDSQRKGVEGALAEENRMIQEAKSKLENLQKKVAGALRAI